MAVTEGPNGDLFSIHRNEPAVHRWTPDGKAMGTIGRRGRGPGEFLLPSGLGFFGDTLWVMDVAAQRASYFGADGTFLHSAEPRVAVAPSPTNPAALVPHPERPLRDGRWFGRGSGRAVDLASGRLSSVPFVSMDSTGALLDTMWVQHYKPYDVLVVPVEPPQHYAYVSQPFGDRPLTGIDADGMLLVVGRRVAKSGAGPNAHFSVTRVDERGDTILHVSYPYQPLGPTRQWVRSVTATMARQAYDAQQIARWGQTESQFEKDVADRLFVPPSLPPVRRFLLGADGSVWLMRFDPVDQRQAWWLIDTEGRPWRWVVPSGNLRILWAGRDHVWGVVADPLGVNYIVRYEIEPDMGEGS